MKKETLFAAVTLAVFLCIGSICSAVQLGVKTGDWARLEAKAGTANSTAPTPTWIKLEFLNVTGTAVAIRLTGAHDGTQHSQTVTYDFASGLSSSGTTSAAGILIPVGSKVGDTVRVAITTNATIAGQTVRTYAGASRSVLYASFSPSQNIKETYYWDKQTGVIVEISVVSQGSTTGLSLTETNMWQPQLFGLPIVPTSFYIIMAAALVVLAALVFMLFAFITEETHSLPRFRKAS